MVKINIDFDTVVLGALVVLVIFTAVNAFTLSGISGFMVAEAKPAQLSVVKVVNSKCTDCFNIEPFIDQLKSANVEISEESFEFDSAEGKAVLEKYGVSKVPFFAVSGEINKSSVSVILGQLGEAKDGSVIFTKAKPPYFDTSTNKVAGLVDITNIVDSSCTYCANFSVLVQSLKQAGVKVRSERSFESSSDVAKALISKYSIQRVPAIIFSKDLDVYDFAGDFLSSVDARLQEGFYAMHSVQPPYIELETGKVVGNVTIVNLVDKSCGECYDVSVHKSAFEGFVGIGLWSEETYDISSPEGKALIEKYKITKVPTAILSPDIENYPSFESVWQRFALGTKESDNFYVIRNVEIVRGSVYKDMTTGKIVKEPVQASSTGE